MSETVTVQTRREQFKERFGDLTLTEALGGDKNDDVLISDDNAVMFVPPHIKEPLGVWLPDMMDDPERVGYQDAKTSDGSLKPMFHVVAPDGGRGGDTYVQCKYVDAVAEMFEFTPAAVGDHLTSRFDKGPWPVVIHDPHTDARVVVSPYIVN